MKDVFGIRDKGSVLLIALLTITILTMICATSLYITTQNPNAGMQTASWQQALTAAESGVDAAIRALNQNGSGNSPWTNWVSVSGTTLPTSEPSPSPATAATAAPDSSHYNYLPSSILSLNFPKSEGVPNASAWVTIDTAGMQTSQDTNGKQWYRVRSTGQTVFLSNNGPMNRVSNNRLDNDLRNTIALRFNRKGSSYLGPTRTIEVILSPVTQSNSWVRGITTLNSVNVSGSGIIDSFDSSNPLYNTNGLYDSTKRESHGDIGILNSTGSNFNKQYVYGNVAYSGPAIKNTQKVQGTISTPYSANITIPVDPTAAFAANGYTTITGNPPPTTIDGTGGTQTAPVQIKINGQFQLSGNNVLNITGGATATASNPAYVTIWVTDQWQTSGSSVINQSANVKVTWYVDKQIQMSGSSYTNSGIAANVSFIGTGTNQNFQISGNSDFIGTINAPNYTLQVSGSGSLVGAVIANSLALSGSGGVHYDQTLGAGNNPSIGNFAFASWFEDNSDPTHKDAKGNYIVY